METEKPHKIIEFLTQLPEPYKSNALANYEPSFYEEGCPIETTNDAIGWAFDWSISPQGEEYWMALRRHLEFGETLPEQPASESTSLLNQIESLKKENERARELITRITSHIGNDSMTRRLLRDEIQSFLNEQKPEA